MREWFGSATIKEELFVNIHSGGKNLEIFKIYNRPDWQHAAAAFGTTLPGLQRLCKMRIS
jgi:hypothetical protein